MQIEGARVSEGSGLSRCGRGFVCCGSAYYSIMYLARARPLPLFLSFPVRLYVCSRACARALSLSLSGCILSLDVFCARLYALSLFTLSVSLSFFVRACWPTSQS